MVRLFFVVGSCYHRRVSDDRD